MNREMPWIHKFVSCMLNAFQDFPDIPSKSQEAVDDSDDDDNDSNDTDESDEVVTDFPTEAPVTPFNRGDNAGRGDSVAYGFRAKAHMVKASKLRKTARKVSSAVQQHLGYWEGW